MRSINNKMGAQTFKQVHQTIKNNDPFFHNKPAGPNKKKKLHSLSLDLTNLGIKKKKEEEN